MKRFHIINEYHEEVFNPDALVDFVMDSVISEDDVHYIIEKLKDILMDHENSQDDKKIN